MALKPLSGLEIAGLGSGDALLGMEVKCRPPESSTEEDELLDFRA